MSGYVVPGGSTVQPSQVAYRAVSLTANTTLVWPFQSQGPTDFAAATMDVTASAGPFVLTLPPANQVSTGYASIISNVGSNAFTLNSNAGTTIASILPGQRLYIYLSNNATADGTWGQFVFGVGTSTLSAGSIAGAGLTAIGALLNTSHGITTSTVTPYNVSTSDRSKMLVWNGGVGVVNLPTAGSVGNGFFGMLANKGTGTLTVTATGGDTIDGTSSVLVYPNNGIFFVAGNAGTWYTFGNDAIESFNFTELVQTVTGGTLTETMTQAQNVVQRFTGTLTSNQTVVLPGVVQVYYLINSTTGAFSLTFQAAGLGTTVTLPQGQNGVFFSDGTNMYNANTTLAGINSFTLGPGSLTAPSIDYVSDLTTGIYQPASGTVGFVSTGAEVGRFTSAGLQANALIPTGSSIPTNGLYLPAVGQVGMSIGSTLVASWTSTGESAAGFSVTGSGVPANGIYLPSANTLGFSSNTVARGSISSTGAWTINAPSSGPALVVNGNVGVGVTPSAWYSAITAEQFGATGSVFYDSGNGNVWLARNLYKSTSSVYNYITTDFAAGYAISGGSHQWYIAPSGTAGNPITFTQAMTLSNAGNVTIYTPSSGTALTVNGSIAGSNGISISAGLASFSSGISVTGGMTLDTGTISGAVTVPTPAGGATFQIANVAYVNAQSFASALPGISASTAGLGVTNDGTIAFWGYPDAPYVIQSYGVI